MHSSNVVSMELYKARHARKHNCDTILYAQLKGRCSVSRIERAQRMCAANIRNGTPERDAIQAAARWAAINGGGFGPSSAA